MAADGPMLAGPRRPRFARCSAAFARAIAVIITLRVAGHVWNLRSSRASGDFARVRQARCRSACGSSTSVLGNHHLIVEADITSAFTRVQGLCIRIAKALNQMMDRHGRVLDDHYHSRLLRTPTELVRAIAYVLGNAAHHYSGAAAQDRYSSAISEAQPLLCEPRSWLLRVGWRRARTRPLIS
jgi:hypothetical protein